MGRLLASLVVVCVAIPSVCLAGDDRVGRKIDNFTLKSHFGKEYSLADFANRDVVVVAFVGAECPLARLYGPRLAELAEQWPDKVAIVGIDSNQQDSLQEIGSYAARHDIKFPILKDTGNVVADRFGAERTPEVFVLDRDRTIRYQGRIDDQYGFADGVGFQRPAPSRKDLAAAVDELLAGQAVSVPTTQTIGCVIGRVRKADPQSEVTYSNQIARIFQQHCVECHRPGQIGPFVMTGYDEVVGWGEMIREVVDQGRMPPWHANPAYGHFQNDLRLSDDEKQLVAKWVEAGCPEGDPSQLPPARQFTEGWAIGEPEQIIYATQEPVDVPAEGVIDYHHYVVDPGWTEDKWIMAAEAKPGSIETVHHILVFVIPPAREGLRGPRGEGSDSSKGDDKPNVSAGEGQEDKQRADKATDDRGDRRERRRRGGFAQGRGEGRGPGRGGNGPGGGRGGFQGGGIGGGNLIAGYAPGANPMIDGDGTTAMHIKAGSKLLFQMHYTPNGAPQKDRSYVGFRFADPAQVQNVARSTAVATAFFAIPPGAEDYQIAADTTFEYDTLIANLTPHMHTRGKAFRYEAFYPDGKSEILLDVPRYDFNWQTTYCLAEPKFIPKGTRLVCTAHWDNSEHNLSNPDPTKTVTWGDQTFEEMMIGFYVEVFPKGEVPPTNASPFGRLEPEKIFDALDANKDGKLTKDEMPDRLGERMALADLDRDGGVSKEELTTLLKLFSGRREGQGDGD